MTTLLVFCPNLVGDTVMATPAFRALRKGFPDARIVAVVKPKVAPTLDGAPWFDDRIGVRPPIRSARGAALRRPPNRLRRENADLAVLFPNSFRSAWLAWRSGARVTAGRATLEAAEGGC